MNRYYVGAEHIGAAVGRKENFQVGRPTIESAILEAKRKVEAGTHECLVVVKIVAVVKRASPPVSVEYLGEE